MGRRLADVPIQPASVDCTPSARLWPIRNSDDGVFVRSQVGFTVLGISIAKGAVLLVGTTGMCSQTRRLFHSPARALEGAEGAIMMGLAALTSSRWRKPLVKMGLLRMVTTGLSWADEGFALPLVTCAAGAEIFEPVGPVTEVRVRTTVLPTYETLNTSVPTVTVLLVNVPESVPVEDRIVNCVPMLEAVNTRPFTIPTVSVPPRLAVPLTVSSLYVPVVSPPMETFIVPVANCV